MNAERFPTEHRRLARSKADTTCPNCLEKGHASQECTKPNVDVKDRTGFNCSEPGHPPARCPKGKLKALIRNSLSPDAGVRGPAPKYTFCFAWGEACAERAEDG